MVKNYLVKINIQSKPPELSDNLMITSKTILFFGLKLENVWQTFVALKVDYFMKVRNPESYSCGLIDLVSLKSEVTFHEFIILSIVFFSITCLLFNWILQIFPGGPNIGILMRQQLDSMNWFKLLESMKILKRWVTNIAGLKSDWLKPPEACCDQEIYNRLFN